MESGDGYATIKAERGADMDSVVVIVIVLFLLVGVDIALYFRNAALDRQRDAT